MIICTSCGNTGKFRKRITYREIVEETAIVDGKSEDEEDHIDNETVDSERSDEGDIECAKCNSRCEYGLDEKEMMMIKWKHTGKRGRWSKEELPKNKRNEKLGQEVILEAL